MRNTSFKVVRIPDVGIEAVEAETDWSFGRHTHDQFGIGFVVHGAQRSSSGRGEVESMAGDLITVNPGEVHDGVPVGGARRWHMLYVDPARITTMLQDMAEDGRAAADEFSFPILRSEPAANLFQSLYQRLVVDAGNGGRLEADGLLFLLLEYLIDRKRAASAMPVASIARARAMIDDDPVANTSLAQLAQEAGLSRFQLVRGFSRLTGLTPHAYMVQRRLLKARQLIASGTSLADAAADCGFSDQSHMTRFFVRSFGYSPGVYAGNNALPSTSAS